MGHDSVSRGAGRDLISGDLGNDTIDGGAANDTLIGADGDDHIIAGGGVDLLRGGAGADSFVLPDGDRPVVGKLSVIADWKSCDRMSFGLLHAVVYPRNAYIEETASEFAVAAARAAAAITRGMV